MLIRAVSRRPGGLKAQMDIERERIGQVGRIHCHATNLAQQGAGRYSPSLNSNSLYLAASRSE